MSSDASASKRPERIVLTPDRFDAVVFDLDGVLTDTAELHAEAWAHTFDAFLDARARRDGHSYAPFSQNDYLQYVDGRPRTDGIRAFLAARGLTIPEGELGDPPEKDSVQGLSKRKNAFFLERLRRGSPTVLPGAVEFVRALRASGFKTAVVSASRNCIEVLRAAGLDDLFDARVDGLDQQALNLPGKPAPDTFLEATRHLGAAPSRTVIVEDAAAGVEAGRRGAFGLVVGVDRSGRRDFLIDHGADIVVPDLTALVVGPASRSVDEPDTRRNKPHMSLPHSPFPVTPDADAVRMGGKAELHPWVLVYDHFDPVVEGRRETLCALGNGNFVTRGAAAEARAEGAHYPGTYLAGGYNRLLTEIGDRTVEHEDLVNVPNWLPLAFRLDGGPWFRLQDFEILTYRQELDLRRGLYRRTVRLRDAHGRDTCVTERRLVHMRERHLAGQHVQIRAENWSGRLQIRAALDGDVVNAGVPRYRAFDGKHLSVIATASVDPETILLQAETVQSRLRIAQAARIRTFRDGTPFDPERSVITGSGHISQDLTVNFARGESIEVEKIVAIYTSRDRAVSDSRTEAQQAIKRAQGFDGLLETHILAWALLWKRFDVGIVQVHGEALHATHLIVRLHIFHLLQTVSDHTVELDVGVPARGWHGEGYRGHIFWDELFILPFLTLRIPALTRALLLYRYRRLPEARWAARAAGYRGAMFPWQSGSNGREETDVTFFNPRSGNWIRDNTHLQRHVGAAIAYNIWQYYQATDDTEFLYGYGAELLFEIARFWASIARWNPDRQRYEIRGVMGPDEFHDAYPESVTPGLNNNAYTNIMAAWCLAHALRLFDILPRERCEELCTSLGIERVEIGRWDDVSRRMFVPFHDGIISQFEGYETLAEFDWKAYRDKYGNIMRLDLLLNAEGQTPNRYKLSKQADVLMLFYLFSAEELVEIFTRLEYPFSPAAIPKIIDYYLERTSHGSTLSGLVHAWVLARSLRERSWTIFKEALQSDVSDIQGGTTAEGIHLGAMAGTVDLLQRCYTGFELRGNELRFNPALPDELERLSYRLRYRGQSLELDLTHSDLAVASSPSATASIMIVVQNEKQPLHPGERTVFRLAARATPPAERRS